MISSLSLCQPTGSDPDNGIVLKAFRPACFFRSWPLSKCFVRGRGTATNLAIHLVVAGSRIYKHQRPSPRPGGAPSNRFCLPTHDCRWPEIRRALSSLVAEVSGAPQTETSVPLALGPKAIGIVFGRVARISSPGPHMASAVIALCNHVHVAKHVAVLRHARKFFY